VASHAAPADSVGQAISLGRAILSSNQNADTESALLRFHMLVHQVQRFSGCATQGMGLVHAPTVRSVPTFWLNTALTLLVPDFLVLPHMPSHLLYFSKRVPRNSEIKEYSPQIWIVQKTPCHRVGGEHQQARYASLSLLGAPGGESCLSCLIWIVLVCVTASFLLRSSTAD
jgi:hypothetical protein